jgi:hypothetical protein
MLFMKINRLLEFSVAERYSISKSSEPLQSSQLSYWLPGVYDSGKYCYEIQMEKPLDETIILPSPAAMGAGHITLTCMG